MSKYNLKYELNVRLGATDKVIDDFLEVLDEYGPYAANDPDEYRSGRYSCWIFSDPDFMAEGCEDDPYTLAGRLYQGGNIHQLAIASTIFILRHVLGLEDDEIFDFFVAQGEEYFGDTSYAILSQCLHAVGSTPKYFDMPAGSDWDE